MIAINSAMRWALAGAAFVLMTASGYAPAALSQEIGINSAVNPDASGTPPGGATRQLVIGQNVIYHEHIITAATGQTQIVFVDQSSLSVGPNSDIVIDEFVYDPKTGTGKLAISATTGVLRFVGGKLSKNDNGVTIRAATTTIGIRGGEVLVNVSRGGGVNAIFIYGKKLTMTGQSGCTQGLARVGYELSISHPGGCPTEGHAPAPGTIAGYLAQLDGQAGSHGGATVVPTDQTVAQSGVSTTISGNIAASIQAAIQTQPPPAQPPQVQVTTLQTTLQVNTVQPQPVVTQPTPPPLPPPSPSQVSFPIAGAVKAAGPGTVAGFIDPRFEVAYAGAQLTYPSAALQNGVASFSGSGSTANGTGTIQLGNFKFFTGFDGISGTHSFSASLNLSPISAGASKAPVSATVSATVDGFSLNTGIGSFDVGSSGDETHITVNQGLVTVTSNQKNYTVDFNQPLATGTATVAPDGNFFFADLLFNDPDLLKLPNQTLFDSNIFIMGGTPMAPSFFAPQPANQYLAFNIQPDAALANGGQAQTIPFLPSFAGGTMANATVSPLLAVNPANTAFGSHNNVSNPTALGTPYLQASLDIDGAGANQSSALVVTTGGFSTSSDNGQVIASGQVRGTVFTSATAPLDRIASASHSVVDGNGNSLFGDSTIDGFVLDQNANTLTGNYVPQSATEHDYVSGGGSVATSYGFNQPVTATTLPTGTGATRSALNETGYFGGAMQCCSSNSTTNAIINYGVAGTVTLQTDPASDRLAATFTTGAPFISTSPSNQSPLTFSGLNALTLQFGSLPAAGPNEGRSTFIDDNTFAATDSPDTPSAVTRTISGVPTVLTLPTVTNKPSANSQYVPQLALVTSSVVANNALVPGGALCQCQYSQWGFWTGSVESPNAGSSAGHTNDIASINTWIAGTPTVTMPTTGFGSYSGNAAGTVYNNGAQYLASGGLAANYNFATNIGTLTFSNFDGNNFSGIVSGTPGTSSYTASLSGNNLAGGASGTFLGPAASETGGNFGIASESGPTYFASGVFGAASTGTSNSLPAFTLNVSGGVKNTNSSAGNATPGTGFSIQTGAARELYAGGSISFAGSATLSGGVWSIPTSQTGDQNCPCSLSSLIPGQTSAVTSTAAANGNPQAFAGTATMTADGNFFFANETDTGGNPDNLFIFGGVPVNQNFYAGNLPAQVLAFQLQPDGALANGSQAQTIPFLPSNFGGTMPNAVVSDIYVGTGANSPFGLANAANGYVEPKFLQASLAINGQGASQTSGLVITTGNFFENSGTGGLVAVGGPVRGTVMLNATSSPVRISSAVATVPDAAGNNLFGGSTLDGFVLDQNSYSFSGGPLNLQLASAAQFGQTTANFAFNQPATATPLPAAGALAGQNLTESGFFGGLMTYSSNLAAPGNPYALTGALTLKATASNYRVASAFTGSDPFTASQSGINSMVLNFGTLDTPGVSTSAGRGTYINSNIYAAADSPNTASSINGNAVALPPDSTSSAPSPSLAMVTSGTVPNAIQSVLPAGVSPCTCQYLQWGYWTGQVSSTTSQGLGVARTDRAYINTWVAGTPTVTMPTTGVGTYSGAAVGTVFNNGASYVAAGGFNQTYNFGSQTGTVNITNFDGANYSAAVSGAGHTFAGGLTGTPNRGGAVAGSFFGPLAVETGGSFNIQSTAGAKYLASGIFAGR